MSVGFFTFFCKSLQNLTLDVVGLQFSILAPPWTVSVYLSVDLHLFAAPLKPVEGDVDQNLLYPDPTN